VPWKKTKGGYKTARGGHIRSPRMYEALRRKGLSKSSAARITNSRRKRRRR